MSTELGIIEGFYQPPGHPLWSWQVRRQLVERLAPAGYRFYLYAPKGDARLREKWREPFSATQLQELAAFSHYCAAAGVRFGVGLSPLKALADFSPATRQALADKLAALDQIGIQDLALLFDDAPAEGDNPARQQAELAHWVQARSLAERLFLCPTYYADDPMLDRLYGERPAGYLEQLGAHLDPAIEVFWAGEEVCAREITPGHLREVAQRLGRKPFLWDNYPVNDGPRMSNHLHVRGFTGRSAALAGCIAGHGINPALQPVLSTVAALTLPALYRLGSDYRYSRETRRAMVAVLGEALAQMVEQDLEALQDTGRSALADGGAALRGRYQQVDHPAAREIMAWLDGHYCQPAAATP